MALAIGAAPSEAGGDLALSDEAIIIDGLNVSLETPELIRRMADSGVTAVNWTCCVWEGVEETLRNVALWKQRFVELADAILQVYSVEDIHRAKREGRLGIFLGWQNTSGFGDYLPLIPVFGELGLRVVQLTYNTACSVGSGCYEQEDRGLTDFGREVIDRLNAAGILIDLSHVGRQTTGETIRASGRPVCFSHTLPAAQSDHPRNKTDEQLRLLAEHGGFVGATIYPAFLRNGYESTLEDYLDALEHLIDVVGEQSVGVGTDFIEGRGDDFLHWITHDKGYARPLVDLGPGQVTAALGTVGDFFPRVTLAMERRGWTAQRVEAIVGQNWLRFLADAWQRPEAVQ
jgi:membrane dipeptidase